MAFSLYAPFGMNTQPRDVEELKNLLILTMTEILVRVPNGAFVIEELKHAVLDSADQFYGAPDSPGAWTMAPDNQPILSPRIFMH